MCRNLQIRNGYADVDDSQNEMKQFLKDCNLVHHLETLTYSGFLDVEDLIDEDIQLLGRGCTQSAMSRDSLRT